MGVNHALVREALLVAEVSDDATERAFWRDELPGDDAVAKAYIRFAESLPVNSRIVFYETMSGERMTDSPLAMFEEVLSDPEFEGYLHVWSVDDLELVPERFSGNESIVFTRRGSLSYAYFLAAAGFVICNTTLPMFFDMREGQRYLNTWHGIPFKSLGRDMPRARYGGSAPAVANLIKATHVISPCAFMTDALVSAYSMNGMSQAKMGETGYPRIDLMLHCDEAQRDALRADIGLSAEKPVLLYAPTWRTQDGESDDDAERIAADLAALTKLDMQVLYRGHHRLAKAIGDDVAGESSSRVVVPPAHINSNELLAVVDILVTDYSSVFFDFLPTGRPIVHYMSDLEQYSESQGLYLAVDELPGALAYDRETLVAEVADAAGKLAALPAGRDLAAAPLQGERYTAAMRRFLPHEDGDSTRRAVDFFFADITDGIAITELVDARPSVVFWAGELGTSLASEGFLLLAAQEGDSEERQSALVFSRGERVSQRSLRAVRAARSHSATVMCASDAPVLLENEEAKYQGFVGGALLEFSEVVAALTSSDALRGVFEREYDRQLGGRRFDSVHLSPGLTNHELALAAISVWPAGEVVPHDPHELELFALSTDLESAQSRVRRLQEQSQKRQEQVGKLKDQLERLRAQNEKLKGDSERLKHKLESITDSRSWKVTAPLRGLKKKK